MAKAIQTEFTGAVTGDDGLSSIITMNVAYYGATDAERAIIGTWGFTTASFTLTGSESLNQIKAKQSVAIRDQCLSLFGITLASSDILLITYQTGSFT